MMRVRFAPGRWSLAGPPAEVRLTNHAGAVYSMEVAPAVASTSATGEDLPARARVRPADRPTTHEEAEDQMHIRAAKTIAAALTVALATTLIAIVAAGQAAAGGGVRAVKVAGGLNGPSAFTFTPKGTIVYLERRTGEVRFRNPKTDFDRLFFRIPGVNGEGERGALGVALHPRWPEKPFVYVYVTRRAEGRLRNQIVRIRDRGGEGKGYTKILTTPREFQPVPQRRARPVRPRRQALRDRRRRTRCVERPRPHRQPPWQDPPHEPGRLDTGHEPDDRRATYPHLRLRHPQPLRLHVRSRAGEPLGDRKRPGVQRRDKLRAAR